MKTRQLKKYIKQEMAPWEYSEFLRKEYKNQFEKEAKQTKNKKQLIKKLSEV